MSDRPNIIVIIMDDLCWGDLACHGNPYTRTPNLDRLHSESARLLRYYSGPLCSPARASLMTGRYSYRTGVVDTYLGRSMLYPDEVTLAECLAAAGYRTGLFGKWHLGDNYPMRPHDQGFEEALWHKGGGMCQPSEPPGSSYFDPLLEHNGRQERHRGYCTDIFGDAAVDFIEQHRDEAFFVYLATNCPHSPFQISDEYVDPYRKMGVNETHAKVYGMIENIDINIGKVLDKLSELGLDENTILMFTSDHGPCPSACHEGQDRFNCELRGRKGTMYDGGIRVPCFFRLPGQFAPRDIDTVSNPIDVMPTVLDACGVELPSDRVIDGLSMIPFLRGEDAPIPERNIFVQWHRGDVPELYRNCAAIDQQFKLVDGKELYDLVHDPLEKKDIAADFPEAVCRMRQAYANWYEDVSSTRGYDPPRIHLGTDQENPSVLTRQDWRMNGAKDGWGDNDVGAWEVLFTRAGKYRFELDFPIARDAETLTFRTQSCELKRTIAPGEDSLILDEVPLDAGEGRIEAWLESEGPRRGMKYVTVSLPE